MRTFVDDPFHSIQTSSITTLIRYDTWLIAEVVLVLSRLGRMLLI